MQRWPPAWRRAVVCLFRLGRVRPPAGRPLLCKHQAGSLLGRGKGRRKSPVCPVCQLPACPTHRAPFLFLIFVNEEKIISFMRTANDKSLGTVPGILLAVRVIVGRKAGRPGSGASLRFPGPGLAHLALSASSPRASLPGRAALMPSGWVGITPVTLHTHSAAEEPAPTLPSVPLVPCYR